LVHLTENAFPFDAGYIDKLGLYSLNPLATARSAIEDIEVQ
jgi:hypothetical protein